MEPAFRFGLLIRRIKTNILNWGPRSRWEAVFTKRPVISLKTGFTGMY